MFIHYSSTVTVHPAFSISFLALAESAWTITVRGCFRVHVPKIFTFAFSDELTLEKDIRINLGYP